MVKQELLQKCLKMSLYQLHQDISIRVWTNIKSDADLGFQKFYLIHAKNGYLFGNFF